MNKDDYQILALKWAPINYQYIKLEHNDEQNDDVSFETKTDLLVPVNLDGYAKTCKCGYHLDEHNLQEKDNKFLKPEESKKCDCKKFISKYENDDEEWNTENIRKRLEESKIKNLIPVVYYSIATTKHYFYILYSFYHANDEKHPNDMEGCMTIIERPDESEKKEKLVGMITVAHIYFPRYVYKKRLIFDKKNFLDTISEDKQSDKNRLKQIKKRFNIFGLQGKMEADDELDSTRALIQQETQGHGLYALGEKIAWPYSWVRKLNSFFGKLDVVVYYPSTKAKPYNVYDLFRYKGMPHTTSLYYELVDIHAKNGLFNRRIPKDGKKSNKTFNENGKFHGNDASPPWLWVEKKIGDGEKNDLTFWEHPAQLAERWFSPKTTKKPFLDEDGYIKTMSQSQD